MASLSAPRIISKDYGPSTSIVVKGSRVSTAANGGGNNRQRGYNGSKDLKSGMPPIKVRSSFVSISAKDEDFEQIDNSEVEAREVDKLGKILGYSFGGFLSKPY